MNKYELFKQLHRKDHLLVIGNAWNSKSAQLYEKNGFEAIATTSAAIANTLGYEDGQNIPFEELFFIVKRIAAVTTLPLSVDMEAGYSDDISTIIGYLEQLHSAGVVGINLEDSSKIQGKTEMMPEDVLAKKISGIQNGLAKKGIQIFINARTDGYLVNAPDKLAITLRRAALYESAGADGIFVPFIDNLEEIQTITNATSLPVNVLSMATLPSFDKLQKAGVRRVSVGSTTFRSTYNKLDTMLSAIKTSGSVQPVFPI